jgi:hypothetical protein
MILMGHKISSFYAPLVRSYYTVIYVIPNEFLNHRARLILVSKATILCRNDFLNVNIIDFYVCMGGVDETNLLIPLYVSF